MRQEIEVRARLAALDREVGGLDAAIATLAPQVQQGAAGWRTALEQLAAYYAQRRDLVERRQSLQWVLVAEQDRLAG